MTIVHAFLPLTNPRQPATLWPSRRCALPCWRVVYADAGTSWLTQASNRARCSMSRALKIRTRLGRQPGPIRSFEQSFTENEVFILPTTKIRAPLLSSVEEDAAFHEFNGLVLRNPRVGNLLDCTSISLPLPVDGLPVGLMLIGPRNADGRLLEIASAVEAVLRG